MWPSKRSLKYHPPNLNFFSVDVPTESSTCLSHHEYFFTFRPWWFRSSILTFSGSWLSFAKFETIGNRINRFIKDFHRTVSNMNKNAPLMFFTLKTSAFFCRIYACIKTVRWRKTLLQQELDACWWKVNRKLTIPQFYQVSFYCGIILIVVFLSPWSCSPLRSLAYQGGCQTVIFHDIFRIYFSPSAVTSVFMTITSMSMPGMLTATLQSRDLLQTNKSKYNNLK